jgi:hypothetical protein
MINVEIEIGSNESLTIIKEIVPNTSTTENHADYCNKQKHPTQQPPKDHTT